MMFKAVLTGVAGFVPDYVLTNQILESMVETSDAWIRERTGITERRILNTPGKGSSAMAIPAVEELLRKTATAASDVELLICATVTPDMQFPATANLITDAVGAKNAWGFDMQAACCSWLYALATAAQFIETGRYKKIIVVGVDKMSSIIDYEDRNTCIIFGDGAGAVMLEPSSEELGVIDFALFSDGAGAQYLHMKAGGSQKPATQQTVLNKEHFVYQEGKQVFKRAVIGMEEATVEIMKRNNLTTENLAYLVPHQANLRIIESTANRIGLSKEKIMLNIDRYGNTTSATIPLCLWDWEKKLKKGDNLVLVSFGGGFTWGAIYLKWAYDGAAVN